MSGDIEIGQQISLTDAVPSEWRENQAYEAVLVRLYPSALWQGASSAAILDELNEVGICIANHPARMVLIAVATENALFHVDTLHRFESGTRIVEQHIRNVVLPHGEYLAALSPFGRNAAGALDPSVAEQAVDIYRGVITGALGHSAALPSMFSYHDKLRETGVSFVGEVVEMHIPPDSHSFLDAQQLRQWSAAMASHMPSELRQRALTSFRILGAASGVLDPLVRLLNSWVALEVAAGGRGHAERAIANVTDAGGQEIAQRVKRARDGFMHSGESSTLSREDERVIKAAIFHVLSEYYRTPVVQTPVK